MCLIIAHKVKESRIVNKVQDRVITEESQCPESGSGREMVGGQITYPTNLYSLILNSQTPAPFSLKIGKCG